jgi:hypothetical protein
VEKEGWPASQFEVESQLRLRAQLKPRGVQQCSYGRLFVSAMASRSAKRGSWWWEELLWLIATVLSGKRRMSTLYFVMRRTMDEPAIFDSDSRRSFFLVSLF